ncbi:P-loop containing nucleoside triphosphate hydrolase protein [Mucidula mucida]|nr:P-loop containing nucleoside triphosphate hydrolase protein [Mucidula mucida]
MFRPRFISDCQSMELAAAIHLLMIRSLLPLSFLPVAERNVDRLFTMSPTDIETGRASFVRTYKLVIIGAGGVGKSALTVKFVDNRFEERYDPTIEDSYRKNYVIDHETAVLEVLDTAGQEEFFSMREQYIRTGEGFLIEVRKLHRQVMQVKGGRRFPEVIVANKCDLEFKRQVRRSDGQDLAHHLGIQIVETSAKTGLNIHEAFISLVREIRKYNQFQRHSRLISSSPTNVQEKDKAPLSDAMRTGCLDVCVVL